MNARAHVYRPPTFYWHSHRRHISPVRLTWHARSADEAFWHDHWEERLTADCCASIQSADTARDELGRILVSEMPGGERNLEAGCGAGYSVAALRYRGLQVEGIEYSRDMVALVRAANSQLPVHFGDAQAIDCTDDTCDGYLSIGVAEHRKQGPELFLIEALRGLKPAGKIIISVTHYGAARRRKHRLGSYSRTVPPMPFFQYGIPNTTSPVCCGPLNLARLQRIGRTRTGR